MVHSEETLEGARLLVEQIWDPLDLFLIHVDAKLNGTTLLETLNGMTVCGNIEFVPDLERVDVVWGDIVSFLSSLSCYARITELTRFSTRAEHG
jgi:hypothetical protein